MGEVIDIRSHARFIFNQMTDGMSTEEKYLMAMNPYALPTDTIDGEFYDQHEEEINEMTFYKNVHSNMKANMHDFKTWAAWMAFEITVMMLREDKELITE